MSRRAPMSRRQKDVLIPSITIIVLCVLGFVWSLHVDAERRDHCTSRGGEPVAELCLTPDGRVIR